MLEPRLLIIDPDGRRVVHLKGERTTIGSSSKNDICLNHRRDISREHAEIQVKEGKYYLADKQSKYGTMINRQRIQTAELHHGDHIYLASYELPEIVYLVGAEDASSVRTNETTDHLSGATELQLIGKMLEGLRSIGSSGVLAGLLFRVTDDAIELAGADRGFIMLADPDGELDFRVARGLGKVTLAGNDFEISQKIPDETFQTGKTMVLPNIDEPGIAEKHIKTLERGVHAAICLSLQMIQMTDEPNVNPAEPRRIGVLYLDSHKDAKLLSPVTIAGLEMLAGQAAVAIENARLFRDAEEKKLADKELSLAGDIQRALLPPHRQTSGFFDVVGTTIPCRMVGGDFLDYFTLPDGNLAVALADVAGKGPPAALLAALVQGTFTALARYEKSPAETMNLVNQVLVGRGLESRFVTFHYAILAPDGRLISCNAGHNPPIILRGDGSIEFLEVGGLPLGIFETAEYEEESVRLTPDDRMILFSDGVTEAINMQGEYFGEQRLLDCIRRLRDLEANEMLDQLLQLVGHFMQDGPLADDMTVLVIRYAGGTQTDQTPSDR